MLFLKNWSQGEEISARDWFKNENGQLKTPGITQWKWRINSASVGDMRCLK